MSERPLWEQARLFWWKWRHYERNERLWRKARLRRHMLRGDFYLRFPVVGNLLEALDEGRADIGPWVLIEAGCWFALYPETATMRDRRGHDPEPRLHGRRHGADRRSAATACSPTTASSTDAEHRFDDPDLPVTWQGMQPKGPVHDRGQLLVRRRTAWSPAA